jgi:hypothetical protein
MKFIEPACHNRATGKFNLAGYKSVCPNYTHEVRQQIVKDTKCYLRWLITYTIGKHWAFEEITEIFIREINFQFSNERTKILKPYCVGMSPEVDQAFLQSKRFMDFKASFGGTQNE